MDTLNILKLSSAEYCPEGIAALLESVRPGQTSPQVWQDLAEMDLADKLKVPREHVLLTGSGTAALTIAHHFLGNRGKMTVEAPVMTWPSTYCYARNAELRDVSSEYPQIVDWTAAENRVRVPVALWGNHVPVESLAQCRRLGPVIYDCSHAFSWGLQDLEEGLVDAVVYSFGPTKQVPCIRGGAVVSKYVDAAWRAFRDSGTEGRAMVIPRGGNYEIAEPCGALLSKQLRCAEGWGERRQEILAAYKKELEQGPYDGTVLLTQPGASGHLCVVRVGSETARAVRIGRLFDANIQTGVHYPLPLWLVPVRYPCALELSRRILSLPCHVHMTPDDARRVVQIMEKHEQAAV